MNKVDELLKAYEGLKGQRRRYENTWNDITDLVVPNRQKFTEQTDSFPNTELYDSTAVQSNEYLAATLLNGLVNQETKWFELEFEDEGLKQTEELMRILELRADQMYKLFNSADSGFYTNISEMFIDLSAYGTAALESHYIAGEGIKYKAVHLSGLYIATDKSGFVDTVYRRFKFTARQAAQMWGIDDLHPEMIQALEKDPNKKFEIVRCVKPEETFLKKVTSKHNFYSAYIDVANRHVISEGGLKKFPYVVPRWTKLTNEDYGRSPAWTALPDIIMVQAMEMSILEVAEKIADPQLLAANDGVMLPINPEAGGVIHGGIDPITGNVLVRPLNTGGNVQVYDAFLERKKESIRRAFYNNALYLQKLRQMTAEEVATRRDEDFRTFAPNANRVLLEAISPLVKNTYELMEQNNLFEPLPPELKKFLKGQKLNIRFTSPLARTAQLQESSAFLRFFNTVVVPYAQVDPTVLDRLDGDEVLMQNASNLGVPLKIFKSNDEVEQIREDRAKQQELQLQMQLAQQADQAEAQAQSAGVQPNQEDPNAGDN